MTTSICWDCGIEMTPGHDLHHEGCRFHKANACEACKELGPKCDCGQYGCKASA